MGIVFRQSVKTIIVTTFGAILGAFIIFSSTIYLSKQEFGFVRNIINQAVFFSQFLLFGLHNTIYLYIHKYPVGDKRRKAIIAYCFFIPIILTILFIVPYCLLEDFIVGKYQKEDAAYLRTFFYWMPVLTFLWTYMVLLENYLSSLMKVAMSIFFREIVLRILNILFIFLFAGGLLNFYQFAVGTILTYAVPVICLFFIALRTKGFKMSFDIKVFERKELLGIIYYAFFHIFISLSLILFGFIDSLMLAPLDKNGMSSLAVYSIAVFIMSVMQIPYKALGTASTPLIAKAYQQNDHETVNDLFQRSSVNILIVGTAMSVLVACNIYDVVSFLNKGYDAIPILVFIFTIGRIVDMATGLNTEVLAVSQYYKFNFYASAILILMIIAFNRILIPKYGIYGAACGTTLSMILFNVVKYFFVLVKLRLQPFSKNTLLIIFAGAVAGAAGYFLPQFKLPVIDILLRSAVILAVYAAILIWLRPSPDLVEYLKFLRSNKKLF